MEISRILIANRGEIAVRIIRTCRVLGIETILAASEADKDSTGARLADKTLVIGGPTVSTYLNIPVLIKAAKGTGAEAIHPGYGFLSEKPEFSKACEENGIIFIGPRSGHIHKMGNKLAARALANEYGVPTLPGSEKVCSHADIQRVAGQIGYPLIIKAAAGGGGRGMKIVTENDADSADSLQRIFEEASAEASAAFGDGTLYVEKYIVNARHIEVQVLGDRHGGVIHLGERDCSTQRRHQKLIEEAGAPDITGELRGEIHAAAVKLVKNISYENAGTVEFVFDQDAKKFYFLEMNTRLQVEHPVTEMITGVDIVREQINIANGGKLPFAQNDIRFSGHAIECRINAENPFENFKPTPGVVTRWEIPQGPGVRIDTHCHHGYKVPFFYDSLIAKVIVHGDDREHARRRMICALDEFCVDGISTTIPFLKKVLETPDFAEGRVTTRILEKVLSK
jgi:acetyl-CoA carboxylase biotin carboxylase subunit